MNESLFALTQSKTLPKDYAEIFEVARDKTIPQYTRSSYSRKSKDTGVLIPNAFQVPNEIVDKLLPHISGNELKVLLYIIRKTFGYSKYNGDKIALSQFLNGTKRRKDNLSIDAGVGLSKTTLIEALAVLERAGIVKIVRSKNSKDEPNTNYYQLVIRNDYGN